MLWASALLLLGGVTAALPTQQEALAQAFPGASFTRQEHFLTEAQGKQVEALAGTALRSLWVVAYEARRDGKRVGIGFFDTHLVRTQPETALIAVDADGRVVRVEVIVLREPQEYQAPAAWLKQLEGKPLGPGLSLKRDIHPLSGATLTANALTDASRRGLALWTVLYGASAGTPR